MTVKFTNNASTTLATGINNSVTSLVVTSAAGFPDISGANDYCWLTLEQGLNREVVKATSLSSNTFTVVRAQDNTTAKAFNADDKVELRLTSALLQDVIDGLGSGSMMDTDIFTGDGSDTTFTLSRQPDNENNLLVFVDGVFQAHNAYSVSGTTLTFSAAPADTRVITAYHMATTVGGSNLIKATMTGDNSDTTLSVGSQIIHENNVQVFFDGVYQSKSNYSVSGSVITFSTAPPTGVAVEAILNTATNISTATQLADADSDTLIQVEESNDEDTIRMDIAGTEVVTVTNSAFTLKGATPTLTIGDAGAEDTKIVFDGNAQDFYIGLDDSADDLVIGLGSVVGGSPAISIDENLKSTLVGQVVIDPADGVAEDAYALFVRNNEATDGRNYGLVVRAGSTSADESFSVRDHANASTYFKVRGDGNVSIGAASPTYKLNVQGSSTETDSSFAATVPVITLTNNSATDDTYSALAFSDTDGGGNWTAAMVGKTVGQSANMGEIQFWTRNASSFAKKMSISNNGYVTMPLQPSVGVKPSSTQTGFSHNSNVLVTLDNVVYDTNTDFGSSTFTAPVDGQYLVCMNLYLTNLDSAAAYYELQTISSNQTFYAILDPDFGQDAIYYTLSWNGVIHMDASDTCLFRVHQAQGTTGQTDISANSYASFALLH